jgi:hypothetical protein
VLFQQLELEITMACILRKYSFKRFNKHHLITGGLIMKRLMCSVVLLASLSFADRIEIDLPVSEDGWDHHNATFIGVNLKSYLPEDQKITSAALEFTGLQNLMEPENNDILHINLLQSKITGLEKLITRIYPDDQNTSNFFQTNHSDFAWVSDLGSYSDNNDKGAKIERAYKVEYWEKTSDHDREKIKGLREGYHWRYVGYDKSKGKNGAIWEKYSGWTTEDTTITLDVNAINNLMALSDGWIGFGLDADCHYIGNAKLIVTTVPEPGTLSLMFLGLTTLTGAFLIRKRK